MHLILLDIAPRGLCSSETNDSTLLNPGTYRVSRYRWI